MFRRPLVVSLVAVLAAAAPTSCLLAQNPSGGAAATVSSDEIKVELIEAGQQPRRELRLAPKAGLKQVVETKINMTMSQSMSGMEMPAPDMPAMTTTAELEVKEVAPNGDITLSQKITAADIVETDDTDPMVADMMRQQMKGMIGIGGTSTLTSRGITKEAKVEGPEGADPATLAQMRGMVDTLRQAATPFPVEAVGVGAKWKVVTQVEQNGLKLDQTTTIELVGLKDDSAELKVTIEQSAKDQKIEAPGLPPGASVMVKSMKSKGDGRMIVRFDRVSPEESESNTTNSSDISIDMEGMAMEMAQNMTLKMAIKSKVAE